MKKPVGPPFPSSSNDKRNDFARRKLPRTGGLPPAVNAKNPRRIEKIKIKTARIKGTANETGIVTVVVTTATRIGKETATATVTVNGTETGTMIVGEGSTIDETIMTMVTGPRGTTGTENTAIVHRSTIRITTGMTGGSTASIGMTTVRRRAGARESGLPRRSVMKGTRR